MPVIICAQYEKNPSRIVRAVERAQDVPYFSSLFCKVMAEWPWRYRSRSKVIRCDTPSPPKTVGVTEQTRNAGRTDGRTAGQMDGHEWPWRYKSKSKVTVHDTTSHAGKNPSRTVGVTERTRNAGWTDRRTDGRTDGMKPIYPPSTLLCWGYNDKKVDHSSTLNSQKKPIAHPHGQDMGYLFWAF